MLLGGQEKQHGQEQVSQGGHIINICIHIYIYVKNICIHIYININSPRACLLANVTCFFMHTLSFGHTAMSNRVSIPGRIKFSGISSFGDG